MGVVIAPNAERLLVFGAAEPERAPAREAAGRDFTTIYAELAPLVHRFLRDMLGDATLAADATQETFIRAYRGTRPVGVRMAAWVFGIARNVSKEMRRARGRTESHTVDERVCERSPEKELLDREALVVISRALEKLPEDRRAALLLALDHGLSYDEIAQTMNWSLPKTKIEIHRARETLRDTYAEYSRLAGATGGSR